MREHLSIGLGSKGHPGGLETRPQRDGILDDTVMDNRETVRPIAVWVGIAVARLSMSCPSSMADAGRAFDVTRQQLLELADASLALGNLQLACVGDRDAGRGVAAVLE